MEKKRKPWLKNAWLVVGSIVYNCLVYYGTKLVNGGRLHEVSCRIDDAIPFLPWTVFIYVTFFVFWAVSYFLALQFDPARGKRVLLAHVLGETVCLAVYLAYPTTMLRPEVVGTSLAAWGTRFIYWIDVPTNLFPSIHCMVSTLGWMGVCRVKRLPGWLRVGTVALGVGICISTLTVKQHVFADLVSGLLLAVVCYLAAGRLMPRLEERFPRREF